MDDASIRLMAFSEVGRRLKAFDSPLSWESIIPTFQLENEQIYLANRARGIFKPRQMKRGILSVKTTVPRAGRNRRYKVDDRRNDALTYAFQGEDAQASDNLRLKEAFEDRSPFIYFFGVAEGKYEPLWPCFITAYRPTNLEIEVQVGTVGGRPEAVSSIREEEREYRTTLAKQRIHQSAFREMILSAYGERCALSGLPIRSLLTAAHIFPDGHLLGIAAVTNGIALSTLHHAAYDANLIGISPEGIIHVSDRLLSETDGPLLESGLKALRGEKMRFPTDQIARPDRHALAYRFEEFRAAS
ncbi:HNH endonuclease [Luteolibacter arcticus]|uniref:HNH endonuclease n=1 Tax=Luteolibacter arcticus TaxID=1581411 RepID=A0ABT3GG52_9BACT|nr:HNH endonuclease [Luteolibacter arcticus]MCW1922408.1 HNH endonuclease [Luteolibacter arcticus]